MKENTQDKEDRKKFRSVVRHFLEKGVSPELMKEVMKEISVYEVMKS